jgi:branched-chain amino acid transport system permease protein
MQWVNIIIQGILLGSLYALYGMGLSLIYGVMRLVNLAHGDFIVIAAYAALVITQVIHVSPFVSLLAVIPILFCVGYVLQRGLLNRTLASGPLPALLITFGLSIIAQNVLQLVFTSDTRQLDFGTLGDASLRLTAQISIGVVPLITLIIAFAIAGAMQLFIGHTRQGRAFTATSDDQATAELMGVNTRHIYGIAMGLSFALIAVSGVLLGARTTFAPTDGPGRLIFAFEAVIIGGLGSLWGTLAGGILLGVAQTVGGQIDSNWFQLMGHLITLLVLMVRPTGLFARTRDIV